MKAWRLLRVLLFGVASGGVVLSNAAPAADPRSAPCLVEVREKGSGWPVPLVQLKTTHQMVFTTDNAGRIALDAPELMGREVWFDVSGHGYAVPADGFGYRGLRLKPEPGGRLRVEVTRTVPGKRLGRATGAGLFAESQKLGLELDSPESGVFGCDSVQNAVHRGRLFWAWGDTVFAHYPLGVFDMSSATTDLRPLRSFEPPLRIAFQYFKDATGRPRGVAKMPGSGPTWLSGYVSLPAADGTPRLCASYTKVRNHLESYEWGLCVWDEATERFEPRLKVWTKSEGQPKPPPIPDGHPALWKDEKGTEWVLFGNPFPMLQCPARFESWLDPTQWKSLEPVKTLKDTRGNAVVPHTGSMTWNDYRNRWIAVFMQNHGNPSRLGELWYAESVSPFGPWSRAVKVVTHDNYTFYNPRIHPEFTDPQSPVLIFEGTYTQEFADRPTPTPRFNYNQVLYRLDLNEPWIRELETE